MLQKHFGLKIVVVMLSTILIFPVTQVKAAYRFANFRGRPPIHQFGGASDHPSGLTPAQTKAAYNLPTNGGRGTIALIGAYDDAAIEKDLNIFSKQFKLPACTSKNGCFEKHIMSKTKHDADWALETSLDVEWAHAIAPEARILLVEAKTPSGINLLKAVDYARARPDVVAISMSWGGAEFPDEANLDNHFKDSNGRITFFASSGDNGTGVSWPAASPNVVAVGGTHLNFSKNGKLSSETAWAGSGGGVSAYEPEPLYQMNYSVTKANGHRAVPDVSYDADPRSGFPVYRSSGKSKKNWYTVGGTSAGAPQWAAIKALGLAADNDRFYFDKASGKDGYYFRDIRNGTNGDCGYFCHARRHYDYVTGLGSPLTVNF